MFVIDSISMNYLQNNSNKYSIFYKKELDRHIIFLLIQFFYFYLCSNYCNSKLILEAILQNIILKKDYYSVARLKVKFLFHFHFNIMTISIGYTRTYKYILVSVQTYTHIH